ncbi:PaaI family thioesterase [Alkalicaulis satelles]|uniref:PaaI family thioesterase n=1 Tax=Alkalicaulis satelles TaxID=2609175 RepID=A0A5M6ZKQ1_9PROT|nr:PaaI family thioesterase [Alkalicaulis satelles]KAA5805399.1 PaaI family thioesterase [Alkalicaulis satelles]
MSALAFEGSGLDILTAWREAGRIPGFAALLGFDVAQFSDGAAKLECPVRSDHANLMAGVHGGVMAGLMDAVTGCALLTLLDDSQRFATTDLQVRYVRAAPISTARLIAEARIVHRGRTLAVAECTVSSDAGVHARGTAGMMITPRHKR